MQRRSAADVARSVAGARLSSAFNEFLYATVAEDGHGMPLSVLSALARVGLDPWQEAAALAGLPREAAIQRLTTLIAELPGGTPTHPGPATNIAALIAFLPRQAGSTIESRQGMFDVGVRSRSLAIAYVLFVILMMGTQWITASHSAAVPAETARTQAAASAVAPAVAPPPPSGTSRQ